MWFSFPVSSFLCLISRYFWLCQHGYRGCYTWRTLTLTTFLTWFWSCCFPDPLNAAHTVPPMVIYKYCMLKSHKYFNTEDVKCFHMLSKKIWNVVNRKPQVKHITDRCSCWCIHIWYGQETTKANPDLTEVPKVREIFTFIWKNHHFISFHHVNVCRRLSYSWLNSCYNYFQGKTVMEVLCKWAQMLQTATCCHISRTSVKTELCTERNLHPKHRTAAENPWIPWQWAVTLAESPFPLKPRHRIPSELSPIKSTVGTWRCPWSLSV